MEVELTDIRQGTWLIIITKHLLNYSTTHQTLSTLDNICFAGKCGSLLIKLSADKNENLRYKKVIAHARLCGIGKRELQIYLNPLKSHGCIDWDKEKTTFEVLAASRKRVLATTYRIFTSTEPSEIENILPSFLEFCLIRPRLSSECSEYLSALITSEKVERILKLVEYLELLCVLDIPGNSEKLYYNGHQFGDKAMHIGKALSAVPKKFREELNLLLQKVMEQPGVLDENVNFPKEVKRFAIGLGLIEMSEVSSTVGTARFLTTPKLSMPSVADEVWELDKDVFHHAKMLLSSLRFGQFKSKPSRGKINDPIDIVNNLISRGVVGPCTAIGEDYLVIEGEGVIKTVSAKHKAGKQFYMELRRREPVEIVQGLLESEGSGEVGVEYLPKDLQLPLFYSGPEVARPKAAKKIVKEDPETVENFMKEIRS
ncbi:MAG: hypothetical protein ACFFG0_33915 [Candidatus Thorarchaeota archaeon]